MQAITIIGLDIAKSVFQVHGVDAGGQVVVQRRLTRSKLLVFFQSTRRAWLGWRPAQPPIIGGENSKRWAIRCD